jgi:hypothetical protein
MVGRDAEQREPTDQEHRDYGQRSDNDASQPGRPHPMRLADGIEGTQERASLWGGGTHVH